MKSKKMRGAVRAPAVMLDASSDSNAPRWLEVAYEGKFKGHPMGEFEFTRATFEQIVENFRAHPAYRPGAEQAASEQLDAGAFDVVQWDMHHASEQPPTSGEIPVAGAPAQGWVLDVRVGKREDGKACLEALTRWLEPARTYIKERRYKWCSVAVWFNAVDPETKKPIGAVLTSVAITNQPFLRDLPALAASIYAPDWYPNTGPKSLVERLRCEFELEPTDSDDVLITKVDELRRWSAPGATVPDGVDIEYALQELRCIFNLPYLSTADEIFAEVDKLLSPLAPAGANTSKDKNMTTQATQPAAKHPAEDLRDTLVITLAKARGVDPGAITNTTILAAVEQGASATADLAALLQGLDAKNLAGALEQIANLKKLQQKLNEVLPAYETAQKQVEQYDAMESEEDVDMALASLGFDPTDEKSTTAIRATLTRDRKANKDKFRADYKIDEMRKTLARERAALTLSGHGGTDVTTSLATQRQTAQPESILSGVSLGAGGQIRRAPVVQDKPGSSQRIDLSTFPGRNDYERAINYVKTQPGGDKLDLESVHERAGILLASSRAA